MPEWLQALLWGTVAGRALLLGAAAGYLGAFALDKLQERM